MSIDSILVSEAVLELARRMGDVLAEGTATAGASATITDTDGLVVETANSLADAWIGIHTGTAIGDERSIASNTTAGVVTVRSAWSATPSTSSKYFVTQRWKPQQYLDAIRNALRHVQDRHMLPLDDVDGSVHETLTYGDLLSTDGNGNGQFEVWSNGLAAAPDGWTADGNTTVDADSDVDDVRRGKYSLGVANDGSNLAKVSQSIRHFDRHAGHDVILHAKVKCSRADRALIRVGDGGVTTAVTDTLTLLDSWGELKVEFTLDEEPKGFDIDLEVAAGSSTKANFDDVRLICNSCNIVLYDLNTRIMYLSKVELEQGVAGVSSSITTLDEGVWQDSLLRRQWTVERGSGAKLQFLPEYGTIARNTHMRLSGQAHAAIVPTSPASAYAVTIEVNPEYILSYGKWYLMDSLPFDIGGETTRLRLAQAKQAMEEVAASLDTRPEVNSVKVRSL